MGYGYAYVYAHDPLVITIFEARKSIDRNVVHSSAAAQAASLPFRFRSKLNYTYAFVEIA